jgi:2,3-dihydroxy-p-cumate/2,3-dihydroxybenzoate 3,4-dioxygenase
MIRYEKLGYVGINVSDLGRSRAFYENVVGLQPIDTGADGSARFRCSDDYYSVILHASAEPGFRYVGVSLEDDRQYAALEQALGSAGIPHEALSTEECALRRVESAWRISVPYLGAAFEFYRPLPEGEARFESSLAKIQRIGHVVFGTPHYRETNDFVERVLNFAHSDEIEGIIRFFRMFPSPYHHGIGVGNGRRNSLHHVNFMVSEIDDVGTALNRFKKFDVPVVFGPGRHIASNSVFLYYLDPDGLTLDYSFGMEEFPEHAPRDPRTLPPVPESLDSWGGLRDPRMAASGIVQPFQVGAGWSAPGSGTQT